MNNARRRKRQDECSYLKNKQMNRATNKERTKVMKWVYHAQALLASAGINMRRVQVRVCEKDRHVLGVATTGSRAESWISQSAIDQGPLYLAETVLHELAHTLFDAPHVNGCPLMHPHSVETTNLKACERVFLSLAKKHAKMQKNA